MASHSFGQSSLVGLELGRYRIIEKIGAGGMGDVYRARDEHLARDVAVKVLPSGTLTEASARKRFHKEALALSKLNHPNIATIHDFDTCEGVDFLVMEYIPGITLSEKLAKRPLAQKEIISLGTQLAEGLSAAHEHGVIHRDLKPSNLRLTTDGRLKILDFGLAKLRVPVTASAATESLGETQTTAGTLPYMAPEQLLGGEIDARTDIHAAGSVLYEMSTGQRPFAEVERSQLISSILRSAPVPPRQLNPKLSPELERIILKCLEKEPENRYQSARELVIDLRRLGAPSITTPPIPQRRFGAGKTVSLAAVFSVSVLTLILGLNPGGVRGKLFGGTGSAPIRSLAVLPLANLSGDPQQEYFADGMTEELITNLSTISGLRVISRTSVMHYKGSNKPLPEIAQEIHVEGVIEGSVQRVGDRVRITAQLIGAAPERHLWASSYERDLKDILALQSDVAQAIVREIKVKLKPSEHMRLATSQSVDPAAYELYLKGRYYWNKRTEDSMEKALTYFQQAIRKDPNYALAYAGVADCYAVLAAYGLRPAGQIYPLEERAAQKALQLDDTLAEAHASVASFKTDNHDWSGGIKEFERAIELNPNYATAHQWYAEILIKIGRRDDALREIRRAQELDPLSLIISGVYGHLLYLARQYDQAIDQCHKTLELDPNFYRPYLYLGWSYEQKKMFGDAIAELQKGMSLPGGNTTEMSTALAHVYAMAGQNAKALELVNKLEQGSRRQYVDSYQIALVYSALGEKDQSFARLGKAFRVRSEPLTFIRADPRADALRSDAQFSELLHSMNLPD